MDRRNARKIYGAQEETKKQAYSELRKHVSPLKARAVIRMQLSRSGFPMGPCAARAGRKTDPAFTDFAGLYQRSTEHENKPPFVFPSVGSTRSHLNLSTKFNFVSDATSSAAQQRSGREQSRRIRRHHFDGNIQSLVLDCIFTDKQKHAPSPSIQPPSLTLRKVYDAIPSRMS
jgi:hypothetical protein